MHPCPAADRSTAMLVKDMGEFKIIDALANTVATEGGDCIERLNEGGFRLRLSIGDDAAAWEGPPGVRVLTTDTMVEGVHFALDRIGWRDLGWKSLAVNLSDIAAMGCEPLYAVVTLGLRGDLPMEGLDELYRGFVDACRACGGAVVGGDIVKSPVFFVTVALEGAAVSGPSGDEARGTLLTRDSASPGDLVAVTGTLGCSAGGVRMLAKGVTVDLDTAGHLRDAHVRPVPRISEGVTLARRGVVAAMDISDGLVDDLRKLCDASAVGATVRANQVPVDDILKRAFPDAWLSLALGGGEDYELLFTAPSHIVDGVATELDVPVSVIGEIVDGPRDVRVIDSRGEVVPVQLGGWDHFARA